MRGFSLLGLNLIAGFMVLLFTIALFRVNPAQQQDLVNNDKRIEDVMSIGNALNFYIYLHNGQLPPRLSIAQQEISSDGVDLCTLLVPDFMYSLPRDPSLEAQDVTEPCALGYKTHYYIVLNSDNTFTISAPYTAKPPAKEIISKTNRVYKKNKNI